MKKLISSAFALAMLLSLVIISEAKSAPNSPAFGLAKQQVTVKRRNRGGLVGKGVRGGKYVGRKTVQGAKYVGRKSYQGGKYVGTKGYQGGKYVGKKSVKGTKYAGKKTWKGTKSVGSKTKKVLVGN